MAELKTQATKASVEAFLATVPDERRRADAVALCKLMARVTRKKPVMWGEAIVGFGARKLRYPDGREIDWMQVAFSPRKAELVVYLNEGYATECKELLATLGKHRTAKACLYIKKLADVDAKVLGELVLRSVGK